MIEENSALAAGEKQVRKISIFSKKWIRAFFGENPCVIFAYLGTTLLDIIRHYREHPLINNRLKSMS
jgi:hypothetical protein